MLYTHLIILSTCFFKKEEIEREKKTNINPCECAFFFFDSPLPQVVGVIINFCFRIKNTCIRIHRKMMN